MNLFEKKVTEEDKEFYQDFIDNFDNFENEDIYAYEGFWLLHDKLFSSGFQPCDCNRFQFPFFKKELDIVFSKFIK
jgi:hypothetical protein|tara:strand:+ start:2683 stop:2910 length:228 start_codon:yes stop_codon:yes gene_type:complete